jgi:predicted permease
MIIWIKRRGFGGLEQLGRDVSFGLRNLRRTPGFTAVALLSLAFGIGANVAIFTLLNALMLTTLPVPHPERVVEVQAFDKPLGRYDSFFSYPFYRELSTRNTIFEKVTAKADLGMLFELRLPNDTRRVEGTYVSGTYFDFLHARPYLGRLLDANDDGAVGAHRVCVLSYKLWRNGFAADPAIIGRSVLLNDKPVEVVGVTGPEFTGLTLQNPPDLEVPMSALDYLFVSLGFQIHRDDPRMIWLQIIAQLKAGLSEQRASEQFAALARRIRESLPKDTPMAGVDRYRVKLAPRGFDQHAELSRPLVILMCTVGLVLLIACLNLANLLLARGQDRGREIAMRISLGASRWRVTRQLLTESALLAVGGGLLGFVISDGLVKYLVRDFNRGKQEGLVAIAPDAHVLLFTFAAVSAALLLFGGVPAWLASNASPIASLKGAKNLGLARSGTARLRRGLIGLQVALTVVLLSGASSFQRSLHNLRAIDIAADPEHLILADINLLSGSGQPYAPVSIWGDIEQRVRQLPGVVSSATGFPTPLSGLMILSPVEVPGKPKQSTALNTFVTYASPGYFQTLGIPLLSGRDFTPADREHSEPVAIVNQKFAQTYFPGQNALGKQFYGGGHPTTPVTIIGILRDLPVLDLTASPKNMIYEPMLQGPRDRQVLTVRVRGNPDIFGRQVAGLIHQLVPSMPSQPFKTLAVQRDSNIAQQRMLALLSALFGALALGLSAVGLYGVVSYSVTRRTREIGIRMSVGAEPCDVLGFFVREHLMLVVAGAVIGSMLALAGDRFVRRLLYGVPATDLTSMYIAASLLFLVALAATAIPASRATSIDPAEALRSE